MYARSEAPACQWLRGYAPLTGRSHGGAFLRGGGMPHGVSRSVAVPEQEPVAGPQTRVWVHSRQRRSRDGTTDGTNTRRTPIIQYYQIVGENKWRRKGNRKSETL